MKDTATIDTARMQEAVCAILEAIGEDPQREGLRDTPHRVAQMYVELLSGLHQDPRAELSVTFEEGHHEMVILKDLPLFSLCEHHLLPFYGVAHVGYLPNGRVAGASKVVRLLEVLARRPQIQERLTSQVVDTLMDGLQPRGAAIVVQAEHLCMTMRGVRKPGSRIVTSATRGELRENAAARAEFFSLIARE